jgi:hypothetical protein
MFLRQLNYTKESRIVQSKSISDLFLGNLKSALPRFLQKFFVVRLFGAWLAAGAPDSSRFIA